MTKAEGDRKSSGTPPVKGPRKQSLVARLLRRLESKRRRLKRDEPNIYPLY